jgi:lipid II:glycine glycyltransferase (peptidoglycan interpeptide bridge formation enzyme)
MKNKEKYRELCKKNNDFPLFSQAWWLDGVCGVDNWDVILVEKSGRVSASMPYYIEKKYGQTIVKHPKLTQTLGIYYNYPENQKYYKKLSFEKEMIEAIINKLPKFSKFSQSFDCKYINFLPFYWAGFNVSVKYTYVIENKSIEDLEKNFEKSGRRRGRKKAKKNGLEVYESDDVEMFYKLNKKTFERQKTKIPYSFSFVKKLYDNCKKNDACKILFAKDKSEEVIAASFLVYDSKVVYYLMGGIDPDKKNLGGMDIIQFESIKFAIENGKKFDFEGSMIESIENYFRSFGAVQQLYFNVSKTNSKLLKIKEFFK